MEPKFLLDEVCERCHGPLLAEAVKTTEFVEETWDYVEQSGWLCYACGHLNRLDSEPHYAF